MELDVAQPVVLRPDEGERVGRHLLLKLARPELCVSEASVGQQFEGASPHFHERHVDAFYVLEGELELTVGTETVVAGAGTSVAIPPGIVHAFRASGSAPTTRYLNLHAPDGGFADYLRRRAAGDASASFDSIDVDEPSGPAEADIVETGGGERIDKGERLMITVRAARPELCFLEFDAEEGWGPIETHRHDRQIDSFYVLEGALDLVVDGKPLTAGAGTYSAVPPGFEHEIRRVRSGVLFLNLHAPDDGFAAFIRGEQGRQVTPRDRFNELVDDLAARDPDVEESQMMGRPCIKAGAKMIACFEARGNVAFKLPDEAEREKALALDGARIYDPANNGRQMGGWVEVPFTHADKWADLAATALRLRRENS